MSAADPIQRGTASLCWYRPGKVLQLMVQGEYTVEAADEMNILITAELDRAERPLYLLIDANKMERPNNFRQIRDTQLYMNDPRMTHIFILANDRLVRLALMVIFNQGRANLKLLANIAEFEQIMRWHV